MYFYFRRIMINIFCILGYILLIVQAQLKVHQQMIRRSGNLTRISKSENVSFKMVTERNYAFWWLTVFSVWIPKSRDSNWKSTSPRMSFKPWEQTTTENQMNGAWRIHTKVLQKKCLIGNDTEFENEARLNRKRDIWSGIEWEIEETVWQS